MEAFTPQVMRRWGMDYQSLRGVNPSLIYVSTCLGGASGPYSDVAGFGNLGAALSGFTNLVGWPDRPPAGPAGAYTDYIAPRFITSAILAAVDHRNRTGEGQYVDLSQAEASIHFLASAVLDWEVNGHLTMPDGNRSEDMAPHGVFRCVGDDRWIAIAVADDGQWQMLVDLIGEDAFPVGVREWDFAGRKREEAALEAAIEVWTSSKTVDVVEEILIPHGIAAHRASNAQDIATDPQLLHRGQYVLVQHAELGEVVVESSRFMLSATPAQIERAGPTYGEDNERVLRDILRLDDDEIAALAEAGALQ